jgi:YD repeat-containing protein
VVGDWNRDGIEDVGIYDAGQFVLDANGDRQRTGADLVFAYSFTTSGTLQPVAGDFNGDGIIEVGVFDGFAYMLDVNGNRVADDAQIETFAANTSRPVVGYWNADSTIELGVFYHVEQNIGQFRIDANNNNSFTVVPPDKALNWVGHLPFTGPYNVFPVVGNWDRDGGRGLTSVAIDELGRTVRNWYDSTGHLVRQIGADGLVTEHTYESPFKFVTETRVLGRGDTPDDRVTTYTYDANGNLIRTVDPLGNATLMGYDTSGRLTRLTKPNGVTLVQGEYVADDEQATYFAFKENTSLVTEETFGDTQVLSSVTRTYDDFGYLTSVSNGLADDGTERRVEYTVDILGAVLATTVQDGGVGRTTTNAYADGLLIATTDASAHQALYGYDLVGRPTGTVFADDTSAVKRYDAAGNIVESRDELGRSTHYVFDARGRLVQTIFADGTTTLSRRNGAGRIVAATDPLGQGSVTEYDALNRRVRETLPDADGAGPLAAPVTEFEYNDLGLISQVPPGDVPAQDRTTTFRRDALGRVIRASHPGGLVTETVYDGNGNVQELRSYDTTGLQTVPDDLSQLAENRKRVTVYEYDALGRKISETAPDPDGAAGPQLSPEITYAYDDAGNLVSVTDALGRTSVTRYDSLGRVIGRGSAEQSASLTATGGAATIVLTDHGLTSGDRVLIRNAEDPAYNGVFSITRINANQFSITAAGGGNWSGTIGVSRSAVSTTYDAVGNVASVTDALGNTTTFGYDERNRKIFQTLPDDATTDYAYDDAGNLISVTDARENVTTYEYDQLNRRVATHMPDADGNPGTDDAPSMFTTYDAAGRISTTADALGRTSAFAYDRLGRKVATGLAAEEAELTIDGTTISVELAAHGLQIGHRVVIAGTGDASLDGLHVVTAVISADSFEFEVAGGVASAGTVEGLVATNVSSTAYRADGQIASTTDALGRTTEYDYDLAGRRTLTVLPDPDGIGGASRPELESTYDVWGNVTPTTDARGL